MSAPVAQTEQEQEGPILVTNIDNLKSEFGVVNKATSWLLCFIPLSFALRLVAFILVSTNFGPDVRSKAGCYL